MRKLIQETILLSHFMTTFKKHISECVCFEKKLHATISFILKIWSTLNLILFPHFPRPIFLLRVVFCVDVYVLVYFKSNKYSLGQMGNKS